MSKTVLDLAFEMVAEEVARNDLKPGLVARATAESLGDEKKGRALYLKYRAEQLCVEIENKLRRPANEDFHRQKVQEQKIEQRRKEMGFESASNTQKTIGWIILAVGFIIAFGWIIGTLRG
jgi:hypothetical protein